MKHKAWDGGAITDTFGVLLGQKTVKTECGLRVKMSAIDNAVPTCEACKAEIARQAEPLRKLRVYEHVFATQGFDAANKLDWSTL